MPACLSAERHNSGQGNLRAQVIKPKNALLVVLVLSATGIGPNVGRAGEGTLGQKGSVITEALPRPPLPLPNLGLCTNPYGLMKAVPLQ